MKRLIIYSTLLAILLFTIFFIISYLEKEGFNPRDAIDSRISDNCIQFPYNKLSVGSENIENPSLLTKEIKIERACTESERELGLSFRNNLEKGTGLFFIFENSGSYGFWMKDMRFNIDIIWLDDTLKVINVSENVSPSSYPKSFYPDSPSKYVLELNSGEASSLGLKKGVALIPKK